MSEDAITGVNIARCALILGIVIPLLGGRSFKIGPHASHLLMLFVVVN